MSKRWSELYEMSVISGMVVLLLISFLLPYVVFQSSLGTKSMLYDEGLVSLVLATFTISLVYSAVGLMVLRVRKTEVMR